MNRFGSALILAATLAAGAAAAAPPIERIKLPPGFKIAIYAENIERARSLALGNN